MAPKGINAGRRNAWYWLSVYVTASIWQMASSDFPSNEIVPFWQVLVFYSTIKGCSKRYKSCLRIIEICKRNLHFQYNPVQFVYFIISHLLFILKRTILDDINDFINIVLTCATTILEGSWVHFVKKYRYKANGCKVRWRGRYYAQPPDFSP